MERRTFLRMVAGGVIAGVVRLPELQAGEVKQLGAQESKQKVAEELGDRMIGILNGATKVEAFRIAGRPADKPEGKHVNGHAVLSAAKEQGKEFARRLAALVQDEKSLFSAQARCFNPGVAFRLWKEKESVDVVVCYQCSNLRLVARDAGGKDLHTVAGGFKENYDAWTRIAKDAFPDDKEVQALGDVTKDKL